MSLRRYADAWASCVEFKPRIIATSIESATRQVMLPSEAVLVCGYEVTIGDNVSMMSICIPASAVEAVLPALTLGRALNASNQPSEKINQALRNAFDEVELECHAVFGGAMLSLGEISDLQVGDIIQLPAKSGASAEVWVANSPAFAGVLGRSGKNLAVRISETLNSSEAKS